MKKRFLEPEMEVIKFGVEDVITTSNNGEGEQDLGGKEDTDFPDQGDF